MLPSTVSLYCHTFKLGNMIATDDAKKKVEAFWHRCPSSDPKTSCIVRDMLELTAGELTLLKPVGSSTVPE